MSERKRDKIQYPSCVLRTREWETVFYNGNVSNVFRRNLSDDILTLIDNASGERERERPIGHHRLLFESQRDDKGILTPVFFHIEPAGSPCISPFYYYHHHHHRFLNEFSPYAVVTRRFSFWRLTINWAVSIFGCFKNSLAILWWNLSSFNFLCLLLLSFFLSLSISLFPSLYNKYFFQVCNSFNRQRGKEKDWYVCPCYPNNLFDPSSLNF